MENVIDEQFVLEVEKYQFLYDPQSALYHNRIKRRSAWESIADACGVKGKCLMHVVVKTGFERRNMFIHFTSLDTKKINQCAWKFSKAFFPDTCLQITLGFSVDACC